MKTTWDKWASSFKEDKDRKERKREERRESDVEQINGETRILMKKKINGEACISTPCNRELYLDSFEQPLKMMSQLKIGIEYYTIQKIINV